MPEVDYFRCPACQAKLKFGKRPKARVTCPRCGHQFDYHAPSEPAAEKVKAGGDSNPKEDLGGTAAFGLALTEATRASAGSDAEDEVDLIDDEDQLAEYQPLSRRPAAKTKRPAKEDNPGTFVRPQKSRPTARTFKPNSMLIWVGGAGAVLLLCLVAIGVGLFRNSGAKAAKFEPPEEYVPLEVGFIIPLSGMMPEGWKSNSGGGGGRDSPPIFVKISDGRSISIEIRESYGLKLTRLAGGRLPPLEQIHDYFGQAARQNFSNYEEGPARPIATEGFNACICDFSGKEGLLSPPVKGCRASLVHAEHQYNVICKCPPAEFDVVKPVFAKIISSLGRREKN
jgi:hypothetical protein